MAFQAQRGVQRDGSLKIGFGQTELTVSFMGKRSEEERHRFPFEVETDDPSEVGNGGIVAVQYCEHTILSVGAPIPTGYTTRHRQLGAGSTLPGPEAERARFATPIPLVSSDEFRCAECRGLSVGSDAAQWLIQRFLDQLLANPVDQYICEWRRNW